MRAEIKMLLAEANSGLRAIYGGRVQGIYLFGSHARGDAGPGSDVDILVVLDRLDSYGGEIDRTNTLISDLSLKYATSVSRVFVSKNDWRDLDSPFLASAREDAVAA